METRPATVALVAALLLPVSLCTQCPSSTPASCSPYTEVALTAGVASTAIGTNGTSQGIYYTNDLDCVWNLTAPPTLRLFAWFTWLDIENAPGCVFDVLSVLDAKADAATAVASQSVSNPLVAYLCGNKTSPLPDPLVLGPHALFHFTSDGAGQASGWIANVAAFSPASCLSSNTVTPGSGVFGVYGSSPSISGMPSVGIPAYDRGLDCTWTVQASRPASTRCVRSNG